MNFTVEKEPEREIKITLRVNVLRQTKNILFSRKPIRNVKNYHIISHKTCALRSIPFL